jgi:hypothetical protein
MRRNVTWITDAPRHASRIAHRAHRLLQRDIALRRASLWPDMRRPRTARPRGRGGPSPPA